MGWNDVDRSIRLPLYLKGAADDWYANYVSEASAEKKPGDWQGLKDLMILPSVRSLYLHQGSNTELRSRLPTERQFLYHDDATTLQDQQAGYEG